MVGVLDRALDRIPGTVPARGVALLLGLGASLLALALQLLGAFQGLEDGALDLALRWRPVPALEEGQPVRVVAIDGPSIERFGRWPWPRSRLAELVDAIREAGASVLAVDLALSERSHLPPGASPKLCAIPDPDPDLCRLPEEDCALAEAFARFGSVVLGYYFRDQPVEHREPFFPLQLSGFRVEIDAGENPALDLLPRQVGVEGNLTCFDDSAAANGFLTQPRRGGVFRHYRLAMRFPLSPDPLSSDPLSSDPPSSDPPSTNPVSTEPGGQSRDGFFPPLALAAASAYRGQPLVLSPYQGSVPGIYLGEERIPADETGARRIDYLGPAETLPTISALDLLEPVGSESTGENGAPKGEPGGSLGESLDGALDGALVFLGVTEIGVGDLHPAPTDERMPGLEIHATVAYNLLTGRYLRDAALQKLLSWLAIFLVGLGVAGLVSNVKHYLLGAALAIGIVVLAWPGVAWWAFRLLDWHLAFVAPMAAGSVSLVATLWHQLHLGSHFEGYVSPNVRRAMRGDPGVADTRSQELTVLFTDIRGFSTRTEDMRSDQVVRLLNDFFTPMTRVVLEQDGTLDKYMGDALMAFFGAPVRQPDHAARACRAALAMRRELHVLRRMRPEMEGLDIGVGLHTGVMTVGDMGSQGLFDYTVIGKNVNLGQRLEAATKLFGVPILVSGTTRAQAGEGFLFRQVARLRAKGFEHPVSVHELIVERPAPGQELPGWAQPDFVRRFEAAYDLYHPGRDFAAAERAFQALLDEQRPDEHRPDQQPQDGPSRYYRDRCRALQEEPPPEDWTGVEEQTKK